jgi:excisionase family DNA binding protein
MSAVAKLDALRTGVNAPVREAPIAPTVITVDALAERWIVDRKTLYLMIERKELPVLRVGRLFRIPLAAVESLEQSGAAPSEV